MEGDQNHLERIQRAFLRNRLVALVVFVAVLVIGVGQFWNALQSLREAFRRDASVEDPAPSMPLAAPAGAPAPTAKPVAALPRRPATAVAEGSVRPPDSAPSTETVATDDPRPTETGTDKETFARVARYDNPCIDGMIGGSLSTGDAPLIHYDCVSVPGVPFRVPIAREWTLAQQNRLLTDMPSPHREAVEAYVAAGIASREATSPQRRLIPMPPVPPASDPRVWQHPTTKCGAHWGPNISGGSYDAAWYKWDPSGFYRLMTEAECPEIRLFPPAP